MGVTRESNFPNSRITAAIQAYDHITPTSLLQIQGAAVTVPGDPNPVNALYVQLPGGGTGADVNIQKIGGVNVGQVANPMVKKFYDNMIPVYGALTDTWGYFFGALQVASQVISYTDATKEVIQSVVTTNI